MSDKPRNAVRSAEDAIREIHPPKYEYQRPIMSSGGQVYKEPAEREIERTKVGAGRPVVSLRNFARRV